MASTAFPPHSARPSVILGVLVTGLALTRVAETSVWPWPFVLGVLCLGAGLSLTAVAALDLVRGKTPGDALGRHVQFMLRGPVLLLGAGAALLGPTVLGWAVWNGVGSNKTAGAALALLGILLTPGSAMFGLEAIRAAIRRQRPNEARHASSDTWSL
jgi:hypothetical protein